MQHRDGDPRRHGLRAGVPRRALPARGADPAHRAGQPAHDPQLPGREGPRPPQGLLAWTPADQGDEGEAMPAPEEPFSARSWLFAPGDSDRKMEKAAASPADIVLLDLEDAVTEDAKPKARTMISAFLESQPPPA